MLPGRQSMIAIYDVLGKSTQTDFCYLFRLWTTCNISGHGISPLIIVFEVINPLFSSGS